MAGVGGASGPAPRPTRGLIKSPVARKRARIEIVPLIDVMFFLLASFMMVSLTLQKAATKKMDLVQAKTAHDDFKPSIINVAVDKGGQLLVGTNSVSPEQLDKILSQAYQASAKTPIFVTSDRSTSFSLVSVALDHIRRAGFQHISFVTEPSKAPIQAQVAPK
jgi:biopolymer transport protein ExbD